MNFERIEYLCTKCDRKGTILDIFVNPTVILLRGNCSVCGNSSAVRAIDLLKLAIQIDESEPFVVQPNSWKRENDWEVKVL